MSKWRYKVIGFDLFIKYILKNSHSKFKSLELNGLFPHGRSLRIRLLIINFGRHSVNFHHVNFLFLEVLKAQNPSKLATDAFHGIKSLRTYIDLKCIIYLFDLTNLRTYLFFYFGFKKTKRNTITTTIPMIRPTMIIKPPLSEVEARFVSIIAKRVKWLDLHSKVKSPPFCEKFS